MRKYIFKVVIFSVFVFNISANAQNDRITLSGTIVEANDSKPIPYATIIIVDILTKKALDGTTSDERGAFRLTTKERNFNIQVSFIGYKTLIINDSDLDFSNQEIDLGVVRLSEDSQALEEVEVRAEISTTQFKLDRKVFNVGKDIASTGVSALEVLNNVPSVNVNIEGQISLRGSTGVQILIDGKPSVLADESSNALGTITADMIESIEVITNPSAKYDAEGTSGILNIILKKEEKKGINGSVSINTGAPDNHSVGGSLNKRTEKFNLFTQFGGGYRSLPRDNETINSNLIDETSVNSNGINYRNETFFNLTLGTDYYINPLNVVTLSGNFAYEIEDQPSRTDFSYFNNGSIESEWYREEITEATNPKWQYELNYKKQFENNEDHTLLFAALGRFFGKDQASEFNNVTTIGSIENNDQEIETKFQQADYTFKFDYTNSLNKEYTIESGIQYVINDVGNDYEVRDLIGNEWVVDENLTNDFEYNQKVLGVYGTGAYEGKKWGLKFGLRVENTHLETLLANTNEQNTQKYTDFFPSAHSSYKISDDFSLQAGYSKRIFRPRLWDLNPFFNIRNNYNIRVGNPDLQPEYTDSYEITAIFKIGSKTSLNTSVYNRYTTDVVERVSTFDNNITTTTPYNVGSNDAIGIEINGKYSITKWLSFNGDINFNSFKREGTFQGQVFDFSGKQWSSRLTSKIGLPSDIDLEISGRYQSSYKTIQSDVSGYAFADLGLRKKILKGKAIINVAVRDLFESRISESAILNASNYQFNFGQRGRFVTLGVSYGFGKGEAMTYSGRRR